MALVSKSIDGVPRFGGHEGRRDSKDEPATAGFIGHHPARAAEVVSVPYTPLVAVTRPVPVARLPVLPPVPENSRSSLSTAVPVLLEKSP